MELFNAVKFIYKFFEWFYFKELKLFKLTGFLDFRLSYASTKPKTGIIDETTF